MAQVFPQWANRAPLLLGAVALAFGGFATFAVWYWFSPEFTDVGYRPEQPVPFSHQQHAGDLEISCYYCHNTVERSAVASVPSTRVCMNCHQMVARDKATLEPVRQSAASGQPLLWVRVHQVPEYAYFPHAPHLAAGVGCGSCHGDVRSMDTVRQVEPLSMAWCLDCHRDPAPHLRERDELLDTSWEAPADQRERGARFVAERRIAPPVECSGCHR